MVECPKCGCTIDAFATRCPRCKTYTEQTTSFKAGEQRRRQEAVGALKDKGEVSSYRAILKITLYCLLLVIILSLSTAVIYTAYRKHVESLYTEAIQALDNKHWAVAIDNLSKIQKYKDSANQLRYAKEMQEKSLREAAIAEQKQKQEELIAQQARAREEEERRLLELVDGNTAEYSRLLEIRKNHPDWSDRICAKVAQEKIVIGMTKEQVLASWGPPHHINRSVYSWGTHEQWVYGKYSHFYMYFEDDELTSWQDTE